MKDPNQGSCGKSDGIHTCTQDTYQKMHSFFKKRSSEDPNSQLCAKRKRLSSPESENNTLRGSPTVLAAWNCNGLTSRLRSSSDATHIKEFISQYRPDVFFLSEVRLAAANNSSNGKPGPHTKWYRSRFKESDKKSMEDAALVRNFFNSPELVHYKVYYSLADTKYAGTAMLLNTQTTRPPKSVRYNMARLDVKSSVHDPDGRVFVAKFADFSVLHTYSPNNGWEESHFKRRREWDEKVKSFMARKKEAGVRIMWMGDLNVAPKDEDLSHASYFKRQKGGRNASRKGVSPVIAPEDVGQPGCTERERNGIQQIMNAGSLVDAFRELHGDEESSKFTWRGNSQGKHAGRGMRIDHCLVSSSLMPNVESIEVTGVEKNQAGFMGSDHCPVVAKLKSPVEPQEESHEVRDGSSLSKTATDGSEVTDAL